MTYLQDLYVDPALRPILRRLRQGADRTAVKIIAQRDTRHGKPPLLAMLNQISEQIGIPERVIIKVLWYYTNGPFN